MVLEGIVPVLMQTPPTTDRDSTTTTRFFILEAATAARCPDGPEPITTRSYLAALMCVSPGSVNKVEACSMDYCRYSADQQQHTICSRLARVRCDGSAISHSPEIVSTLQ